MKSFALRVALLTLAGFLLRTLWLLSQPVSVDDYMVGITAINYMESGQLGPTMWNHPGLRNILVYGALKLFGPGVLGLKGWNVLFGTLSIPLLAAVTRRLMQSDRVALTAAFLWAVEPLAIDFSRQAINDIYLAFFPLLGIWLLLRYLDAFRPIWLCLAGIAWGCGLASKWSALFPLLVTGGYLLWQTRRAPAEVAGGRVARFIFYAATLAVLPATLYLLTYLPWFGRGYALADWPALQQSMYLETKLHTGYHETIVGDHLAYEWFVKPVTYRDIFFSGGIGDGPVTGKMTLLLAVADPLVWLLVLPAVGVLLYRGVRGRSAGELAVAVLFLLSYLPLVVAQRPIWVNTALSVLPFAQMAVAYLLWNVPGRELFRNRLACAYLACVLIVSALLYLPVIGKGELLPMVGPSLLERFASEPRSSKEPYLPAPHQPGKPGP
jgi:dolichyl-phosphate-mannose-protein mannosyltransferase